MYYDRMVVYGNTIKFINNGIYKILLKCYGSTVNVPCKHGNTIVQVQKSC